MNNLGTDLAGKNVMVRQFTHTGTSANPMTRVFHCVSGDGCDPSKNKTVINGYFFRNPAIPSTQPVTIDANDIERLATEHEISLVK